MICCGTLSVIVPDKPGPGSGVGSGSTSSAAAASGAPPKSTNSLSSRPPEVSKLNGSVCSAIRARRTKSCPSPPPPAPPPAAVASRMSRRSPSSSSRAANSASRSSSCALASSVDTSWSLSSSEETTTSWPPSTRLLPAPSAKSSSTLPLLEVMRTSPSCNTSPILSSRRLPDSSRAQA